VNVNIAFSWISKGIEEVDYQLYTISYGILGKNKGIGMMDTWRSVKVYVERKQQMVEH